MFRLNMTDLKQMKDDLSSLRAKLTEINCTPTRLRSPEAQKILPELEAHINELNISVRILEQDEKSKPKPKASTRIIQKEKLVSVTNPWTGNSYLKTETDRQGNPIFEKVLEDKKLSFREERNEDGNVVWHVSKNCIKL